MAPGFARIASLAAKSLAIALASLLIAEAALRVSGAGFEPRFFLRGEDGDLHANRHFGRLFFPESLVREGVTVQFTDPKSEGAFRVFVLGESAAMGFPSPQFGLPRVIECLARESFPGRRVEVINAAMAGINSHAVRRIAAECANFQPDAFVVYAGNNEVIGPFGPGTAFGRDTASLARARLATAIRTTKVGQWIDGLLDRMAGRQNLRWLGLQMFAGKRVAAEDPQMATVRDNFRANLRDILQIAADRGVETVLCTMAVNLRDFVPLAGEEARAVYREAEKKQTAGEAAKAEELFSRARDLDELRFRADSQINTIIREEGTTARVPLVDAEEIFRNAQLPGGDAELFWEHVHLTFAGNFLLASAVFDVLRPLMEKKFGMAARPAPSVEEIVRLLGMTASEQIYTAQSIAKILGTEPFLSQPGNTERMERLGATMRSLQAQADASDKQAEADFLATEAAKFPDDYWQSVVYTQALDAAGRKEESLAEKRSISARFPFDLTSALRLAQAELAAGNTSAARASFRRATQIAPQSAEAAIGLSTCAMRESDVHEARRTLQQFLRANPVDIEVRLCLAQIARYEKKTDEARRIVEEVLRTEPQNTAALAELDAIAKTESAPAPSGRSPEHD
jgi:tetratricopeptide (TPR) repeat protein